MERLATGENLPAGLLTLHSLIWGQRTSHKNFVRWLKDCLVKQGMYTQHTEKLLKTVSDVVNNLKYDVTTAKICIIALTPDVKKGINTFVFLYVTPLLLFFNYRSCFQTMFTTYLASILTTFCNSKSANCTYR